MGQPSPVKAGESRRKAGGQPGELKHLSSPRKRNQIRDVQSSGERNEHSLNRVAISGVAGPQRDTERHS